MSEFLSPRVKIERPRFRHENRQHSRDLRNGDALCELCEKEEENTSGEYLIDYIQPILSSLEIYSRHRSREKRFISGEMYDSSHISRRC